MSTNSNTQESVSAETPSVLQQAVVGQAANMLSFAMQYKATRDAADNFVGGVKQAVENEVTNYVIDSINSPDNSNATKLAHTAQGAVLLAATEMMPETVTGAMIMALPVKGLGGSARAGEVPIAGAMLSAAERRLGANVPSVAVEELAVYDADVYQRLALIAQKKQLLADSALRLDAAVQRGDQLGVEQAAIQYVRAANGLGSVNGTVNEIDAKATEQVSPNLLIALQAADVSERRYQLVKAIHIGDFPEIMDEAHEFQVGLVELYGHKTLPVPGVDEFVEASLIAQRIEKAVLGLDLATGEQIVIRQQQLILLAAERDALEQSMKEVLNQPTALASKALMDAAKTLAEETLARMAPSADIHY
jgi:hypothetical protein